MKIQPLAFTLFALVLRAQTPEVLPAAISAVSDTLQNYAKQNPVTPQVLAFGDDDDTEIANQLYIPRTNTGSRVSAAVAAPPSTMINQTSNGTLPVTVSKNYTGLGTGFNGSWTVEGLLPPDTTLGVSPTQILQWVNIKL